MATTRWSPQWVVFIEIYIMNYMWNSSLFTTHSLRCSRSDSIVRTALTQRIVNAVLWSKKFFETESTISNWYNVLEALNYRTVLLEQFHWKSVRRKSSLINQLQKVTFQKWLLSTFWIAAGRANKWLEKVILLFKNMIFLYSKRFQWCNTITCDTLFHL